MSPDSMHDRIEEMHRHGPSGIGGRGTKIPAPVVLDLVDDESADSFPASDPPSWMSMRVGPPGDLPAAF